jgi:hypothetical protein
VLVQAQVHGRWTRTAQPPGGGSARASAC